MKLSFLQIFTIVLLSASASAQIPNFSFENWTNMGTYQNPDQWGTMNNTTSAANVFTATKATPGNPGTAYLKLTSKTVGSVVVNGIAVSGQLDSITLQPTSGFAYTQRPASFTGKWQHMIYGTSQGSLEAKLTRWDSNLNQRITVGTASQTLSGMAMSWANFSINFVYTDGGYPDTCVIVLKASGSVPTNNDYLWVDNLAFSGTVTGIVNTNSANSFEVYPNPSNDILTLDLNFTALQHAKVEMTEMNGRVIFSKDIDIPQGQSKTQIDLQSLAKGAYFVRISSEAGIQVKKIVIQ